VTFDFERHKLCLAEGPEDANVLLALFPQARNEDSACTWMDGDHERGFQIRKLLRNEPDRLEFEDFLGRRFSLRPLTVELYRQRVRKKLLGGPAVRSQAELEEFFLVEVPRYWR
jgi:hypothetical protein